METVSFDLSKQIYTHINRTEKQAILLANRQKWNRLTSALRVLEDTSWAIEYYLNNDYPADFKGNTCILMDSFKHYLYRRTQLIA